MDSTGSVIDPVKYELDDTVSNVKYDQKMLHNDLNVETQTRDCTNTTIKVWL